MFTGIQLDNVKSYYTLLVMMAARGTTDVIQEKGGPDTTFMPPFSLLDWNLET